MALTVRYALVHEVIIILLLREWEVFSSSLSSVNKWYEKQANNLVPIILKQISLPLQTLSVVGLITFSSVIWGRSSMT